MNEKDKKDYLERYKKAKEKGVPFFPDIIFKDVVVSLLIFVLLVALAYFLGVPTESRADPNDATYTPRPEWYFLFLFQLLKYFPGKLEVIGVMVIPGLFILLLFALPFLDRGAKRHFINRPVASVAALLVVAGILALTILSVREAPPPQIAAPVDQAAALYVKNCANCHGPTIAVPKGTDLHQLIAQGKHEGMPAWGGDLSTDEIDALAGFVTSPNGSSLYTQFCGDCHKSMVQASGNPQELQRVFEQGARYPAHQNQNVPDWKQTLSEAQRNALLNFLAAPDGQRLFEINCSGCHGYGVTFTGSEAQLRALISKGGQHLTMPAWQGTLSGSDVEILAGYVTNPSANPAGKTLFGQYCSACHGDKVPSAPDMESARKIISGGGAHVTMPIWGKILTPEQLDALVQYTLAASKGKGTEEGARLFASNCAACHGPFGQGGPNPARSGDMIPPISSAEFLGTRDDTTLRSIISQGQPDLGMNPFGSANGGPLTDEQIDSLVAFIRGWQANPPQIAAAEVPTPMPAQPSLTADRIFKGVCAQCHGGSGEGGSGPALNSPEFQAKYDDQALADLISNGVPSTPMLGVGGVFPQDQIKQLVSLVRALKAGSAGAGGTESTFSGRVLPILQAKCQVCHNSSTKLGAFDVSSYETVMKGNDDGPVVVAGDVTKSLLAQLLQGTDGKYMPPAGALPSEDIQAILDWIAAGAQDN
jgi:mono/diheme cytochrome c family protein